jgi:hypothetical protein
MSVLEAERQLATIDNCAHILALPDLGDPTVADKILHILLLYFDRKPFGDWMPSDREGDQAQLEAMARRCSGATVVLKCGTPRR